MCELATSCSMNSDLVGREHEATFDCKETPNFDYKETPSYDYQDTRYKKGAKVNSLGRNYVLGSATEKPLRIQIIEEIIAQGGDKSSRQFPGTYRSLAVKFRVSKQTIINIWRRFCDTGSCSPKPRHSQGRAQKRILTQQDIDYIRELRIADPFMTYKKIRKCLLQHHQQERKKMMLNQVVTTNSRSIDNTARTTSTTTILTSNINNIGKTNINNNNSISNFISTPSINNIINNDNNNNHMIPGASTNNHYYYTHLAATLPPPPTMVGIGHHYQPHHHHLQHQQPHGLYCPTPSNVLTHTGANLNHSFMTAPTIGNSSLVNEYASHYTNGVSGSSFEALNMDHRFGYNHNNSPHDSNIFSSANHANYYGQQYSQHFSSNASSPMVKIEENNNNFHHLPSQTQIPATTPSPYLPKEHKYLEPEAPYEYKPDLNDGLAHIKGMEDSWMPLQPRPLTDRKPAKKWVKYSLSTISSAVKALGLPPVPRKSSKYVCKKKRNFDEDSLFPGTPIKIKDEKLKYLIAEESTISSETFKLALDTQSDTILPRTWIILDKDISITKVLQEKCEKNKLTAIALARCDIKPLFNYMISKLSQELQEYREARLDQKSQKSLLLSTSLTNKPSSSTDFQSNIFDTYNSTNIFSSTNNAQLNDFENNNNNEYHKNDDNGNGVNFSQFTPSNFPLPTPIIKSEENIINEKINLSEPVVAPKTLTLLCCGTDTFFQSFLSNFTESLRDHNQYEELERYMRFGFVPLYQISRKDSDSEGVAKNALKPSIMAELMSLYDAKFQEYFGNEKWISFFHQPPDQIIESSDYLCQDMEIEIISNRIFAYVNDLTRTLLMPMGEIMLSICHLAPHLGTFQLSIPFLQKIEVVFEPEDAGPPPSVFKTSEIANQTMEVVAQLLNDILPAVIKPPTSAPKAPNELETSLEETGIGESSLNTTEDNEMSTSLPVTLPKSKFKKLRLLKRHHLRISKSEEGTPTSGTTTWVRKREYGITGLLGSNSQCIRVEYWFYPATVRGPELLGNSSSLTVSTNSNGTNSQPSPAETPVLTPSTPSTSSLLKIQPGNPEDYQNLFAEFEQYINEYISTPHGPPASNTRRKRKLNPTKVFKVPLNDSHIKKCTLKKGTRFISMLITFELVQQPTIFNVKAIKNEDLTNAEYNEMMASTSGFLNLKCEYRLKKQKTPKIPGEPAPIEDDTIYNLDQGSVPSLIIASPKTIPHPFTILVDGVEWRNVKFLQASSQWQHHLKTFPIALSSEQI